MRERVCKNCGGRQYKVVGQNMLKCSFCGTIYVDEQASKEEEVLLVGAYEKLREIRFDDAVAEFDKIVSLFPRSFEAHYGRSLAKNKIVFYNNKKGTSKTPRFFDDIPNLADDEDFKRALELAPSEVAKTYNDNAKKISRAQKNQKESDVDVFVCAEGFDKSAPDSQVLKIVEFLQEKDYKTYFVQNLDKKEKEEETFAALRASKVFLYFVSDSKSFYNGEIKNFYDRYFYFVEQRQKAKSSFVVLANFEKYDKKTLPKELAVCKSVIDLSSISFLQDVEKIVLTQSKKTLSEKAKIETRKLDQRKPQKKEVVEINNIEPQELGHYEVENVDLTEENKINWIFLMLKHGDFASAQEMIETEIQIAPNNAELLFAQMLCKKQIKTQEDFFASISNFDDRESLDKILTFANRDFAESFVDKWENLLMSLDNESYYNEYLLYLAKFNTPNREAFVEKAKGKAIETLNEELIEKVLKCFSSADVDLYVNFYFSLAQASGDQGYYEKILNLDQGHEQSQIAMFMQNFKTAQDKLTYQNQEEIEKVFGFLSEQTRDQLVTTIINMILSVAFLDIEQAEKQFDFYLSYDASQESLLCDLKMISSKLQETGFFKQAEKYAAIAISKEPDNADLFWEFLKIKMHCKTNNDVVVSSIKITQMPEWQTLLSISNQQQTEKFAEIVSKSNLYAGERKPLEIETLDKKTVVAKLKEFLLRNQQLILDAEKQGYIKAVAYYKSQLKPFEKYIEDFENIESFDKFDELFKKLLLRLDAMDLTLDSTISSILLDEKESGMKNVYRPTKETVEKTKKVVKSIKTDLFLKRYLFVFFAMAPLLFGTVLFAVLISNPKEVYMNFNQTFLVCIFAISLFIGAINFMICFVKKRDLSIKQKLTYTLLSAWAFLNFVLFLLGVYINPKDIEINTAKEFKTLIRNANESSLMLTSDIDLHGVVLKQDNFAGVLDGNGHRIYNVKLSGRKSIALFKTNLGEIKNLEISLSESTFENVENFAVVAITNAGSIINCKIDGNLYIEACDDFVFGGIAAQLYGGTIENCQTALEIEVDGKTANVNFGGLVGVVRNKNADIKIVKNKTNLKLSGNIESKSFAFGGLVAQVDEISASFDLSRNFANVNFACTGSANIMKAGGVVGAGLMQSENNMSDGLMDLSQVIASGYVGGIYGEYISSDLDKKIQYSYSAVEIVSNETAKAGALVGGLGGKLENCMSSQELELVGRVFGTYYQGFGQTCFNANDLGEKYYDDRLGFDESVWNISQEFYPTLK